MITQAEIQQYQSPRFEAAFADACQSGVLQWYPWVGKAYPSAPCRVLVILESHYINWEKSNAQAIARPDFTRRVVAEQLFPQYYWKSNTFTNLAACLSGVHLPPEQAHRLWEKAALYNFIQRPMETPAVRPTPDDFINGWKAFARVVQILNPQVCLFAGFSALSHLDSLPVGLQINGTTPWEPESVNGTYPRPCFTISLDGRACKGAAIKHPGKFFSVPQWRAVLLRQVPQAMNALAL